MTHPTNPIIDEAEQALRHFGAIDRDNARDLLRMWTYAAELGDAERDAVLARFPQPAAPRLDRAAAEAMAADSVLAHWDGKDLARLRVLIADELQLAWAQGNIAREH